MLHWFGYRSLCFSVRGEELSIHGEENVTNTRVCVDCCCALLARFAVQLPWYTREEEGGVLVLGLCMIVGHLWRCDLFCGIMGQQVSIQYAILLSRAIHMM